MVGFNGVEKGDQDLGLGGGFVNCLDLRQGHGATANVNGLAVAIFIVLPLPDQRCLHPRKRMRIVQPPANIIRHEVFFDRI